MIVLCIRKKLDMWNMKKYNNNKIEQNGQLFGGKYRSNKVKEMELTKSFDFFYENIFIVQNSLSTFDLEFLL